MITMHRSIVRGLASVAVAAALVAAHPAGAEAQSAESKAKGEEIVKMAKKQKGDKYTYGADGPGSFDCSGLVQYAYKKSDIKVPRTSGGQLDVGKKIKKSDKKKGDILVFVDGGEAYHSAIYAGDGKMWEAQKPGTKVGKHEIWDSGYKVRRPR